MCSRFSGLHHEKNYGELESGLKKKSQNHRFRYNETILNMLVRKVMF